MTDQCCVIDDCSSEILNSGNAERLCRIEKMFFKGGQECYLFNAIPCIGIVHNIKNEQYRFIVDEITLMGKEDIIGSTVEWDLPTITLTVSTIIIKNS